MGNQCFGIWRFDERGFLFAYGRTGFCVDLGAKGVVLRAKLLEWRSIVWDGILA